MSHRNAPLSAEGRRRLVERCQGRPISHVAAEMGISRACASKWVNRYRRYGATGLYERSSVPHRSPRAASGATVAAIEAWRREHKWSAARITAELAAGGTMLDQRTVTRHLARLGLARRRFIDPAGASNHAPGRITAYWPGHMVHLDVKKVGRIPDGGGWRVHGRDSAQTRAADRAKSAGAAGGYLYLHSAVDGFSRLAYTEALGDEKGATAAAFLARAKVFFAAHGITHLHRVVTDNGACYRSQVFSRIVGRRTKHRRTRPFKPQHNGKAERYQRIMAEEVLYARSYGSEGERSAALATWNIHYNYCESWGGWSGIGRSE
ncbi:IS481 family transposase [Streptomonospora halophila]